MLGLQKSLFIRVLVSSHACVFRSSLYARDLKVCYAVHSSKGLTVFAEKPGDHL